MIRRILRQLICRHRTMQFLGRLPGNIGVYRCHRCDKPTMKSLN